MKEAREALGLSQRGMAALLLISQAAVSQIESGGNALGDRERREIRRALARKKALGYIEDGRRRRCATQEGMGAADFLVHLQECARCLANAAMTE